MAKANGYGQKAAGSRSPGSSSKQTKSSADSANPGSQYNQGSGPASSGDRNKASADSGKPSSNR
jgi:hypothetical protein